MKRKKLVALLVLLVFLLFAALYSGYNRLFPLAPPLNVPYASAVETAFVSQDHGDVAALGSEELSALLPHLHKAKATRIMSVNDYPTVQPFYELTIRTNEVTFRCMFYTEHGKTYLELPYTGIYTAEEHALSILQGTLEKETY